MTIQLNDLIQLLDECLLPNLFRDYCPNGLQVEGKREIGTLVTGVTASKALIDRAIELQADALLVHHGYFWKGENATITGMKKDRIKALLDHNINLIAYHLPLDGHPELGNNAQLAERLGWITEGGMEQGKERSVGNFGRTETPLSLAEFGQQLETSLNRKPVLVEAGDHPIRTLAWCTGGAQRMIDTAIELGVDAYVSGEISESTVHAARENGVHYISAGHHATERYGVKALGEWIEDKTDIAHHFIDIDSPA